jgi:hypothetical protein
MHSTDYTSTQCSLFAGGEYSSQKEQKVQNKQELKELVVEVWKSIFSNVMLRLVNLKGRWIHEVTMGIGRWNQY